MTPEVGMRFARTGMGYAGIWDRGAIEIAADHVRRRSGELHVELVVSAAVSPAGQGKLHRASFNVSSTQARERLAATLTARARSQDTIPWKDYLEEFCAAVLEAEREGAPIVKVGHLPFQDAEGFLVEPFLPEGKASIVFAPGGVGKSYLAVLIAVMVDQGLDAMGWRVKGRGRVLYLDWETDAYEVDERVKRVAKGLGIEPPEILYRACAGPLDDQAEALAAYIADNGIKLVVVDSVGMASGGSSREGPAEETAIRLFAAFRHLGVTVLAIDHVTGDDSKQERAITKPYGSIYKVNLARSVWEMKGTVAEEGEDSHMALFHRKVNKGRLLAPIGVRVTHTQDAVEFSREEIRDAGLQGGLPIGVRITRTLVDGSMTVSEIADDLDVSEAVIRVTLNRGRERFFRKLPDGTWGNVTRDVL